jgi:hypothetical protein
MNERIRELATQADLFHILPNGNHYPTAMIAEQSIAAYQKFAQLIVQECGQWIIDNAGAMEHLGPEYFAQAMIKDFGVEQ